MDECGVYAQVLYPNAIGIGGQTLANEVKDPALRRLCVEIYNDAMAEVQDWSGHRFLLMPVLPAWSVEECVRETQRLAALGFRSVNMTSDPDETGTPDLAHRDWDALWGGVRGPQPAGALPHRGEPHVAHLLREVLLEIGAPEPEAGDRRRDVVPRQRPHGDGTARSGSRRTTATSRASSTGSARTT
jgi:hypothetical protein